MPVDFQSLKTQIVSAGEEARSIQSQVQDAQTTAAELLATHANDLAALRRKVEMAASQDKKLRCALPTDEALNATYPLPDLPEEATLIAADGSQIFASRHAPIEYSIINVGSISFALHSNEPPHCKAVTELKYGYAVEAETSRIRDLSEREELARLALDLPAPVISLTDGPLELWGGESEYAKALEKYKKTLTQLKEKNITTAGYVDKPFDSSVVRLLEIAVSNLDEIKENRPLRGLRDRVVFEGLLQPGERSAIFGIESQSARQYEDDLALHFFYLNVGRKNKPWLARVEIPKWVADDSTMVDGLHAVLVQQSEILGVRPYPYILHRAHEEALISFDQERQIDAMLMRELGYFGEESAKQFNKDLPTAKTRYSL